VKHDGRHHFQLESFEKPNKSEIDIRAAVLLAFPQPEKETVLRPQPQEPAGFMGFLTEYGCLIGLIISVIVLVFAAVGVYSVFKHL
jgi:hypothetical protein